MEGHGCAFYDVEQVDAVARYLLRTLAAACVEKTFFTSPLSVLDETKRELLQFLIEHTDLPSPPPVLPSLYGLYSSVNRAKSLLDQFVSSKTKLLSSISSKLTNKDKRIEEVGLQVGEGWAFDGREHLARDLLILMDRSKSPVCGSMFSSHRELAKHQGMCPFRPVTCANVGCAHRFSAMHGAEHDAICEFKLLPCKQECSAAVKRGDMQTHCAGTCPMKPVKCPFSCVGCKSTLPECLVDEHCAESMRSHLLSCAEHTQKQDQAISNLKHRVSFAESGLSSLRTKVNGHKAQTDSLKIEVVKRLQELLKEKDVSSDVRKLSDILLTTFAEEY